MSRCNRKRHRQEVQQQRCAWPQSPSRPHLLQTPSCPIRRRANGALALAMAPVWKANRTEYRRNNWALAFGRAPMPQTMERLRLNSLRPPRRRCPWLRMPHLHLNSSRAASTLARYHRRRCHPCGVRPPPRRNRRSCSAPAVAAHSARPMWCSRLCRDATEERTFRRGRSTRTSASPTRRASCATSEPRQPSGSPAASAPRAKPQCVRPSEGTALANRKKKDSLRAPRPSPDEVARHMRGTPRGHGGTSKSRRHGAARLLTPERLALWDAQRVTRRRWRQDAVAMAGLTQQKKERRKSRRRRCSAGPTSARGSSSVLRCRYAWSPPTQSSGPRATPHVPAAKLP